MNTYEQELKNLRSALSDANLEVEVWQVRAEKFKAKWHEARRYLRAANKGAERNAQVMQLQAHTIARLLTATKTLTTQPTAP